MIARTWLILAVVVVPAAIAVAAFAANDDEPVKAKPKASPAISRVAAALRAEARNGSRAAPKSERTNAGVCAQPDSETHVDLPNARLYYANWLGEEQGEAPSANRAAGCLKSTAGHTEFGFNNVIEGENFGLAAGVGDLVAYSTEMWVAADGSDDGLAVWNLRDGHRLFLLGGCSTASLDCRMSDLELLANGTFAFSFCRSNYNNRNSDTCFVKKGVAGKSKPRIVARLHGSEQAMLLVRHNRLYWIGDGGRLKSVAFK